MIHPSGEIIPLHGFVKKSGRKIRAQLMFFGLSNKQNHYLALSKKSPREKVEVRCAGVLFRNVYPGTAIVTEHSLS